MPFGSSSRLPSPLGDFGGTPSDSSGVGGLFEVLVTPEIVPVRIVAPVPIPVRVIEGPSARDPTGLGEVFKRDVSRSLGTGLESAFKKHKPAAPIATSQAADMGLGSLGKAGAALFVLNELKKTFIDPFIGAAKGGFDAGIQKGAGSEVLGKSFQVLGVAIGGHLLPVVIRFAAAAGAAADALDRYPKLIGDLISGGGARGGAGVGSAFGRARSAGGFGRNLAGVEVFPGIRLGGAGVGKVGGMFGKEAGEAYPEALRDVLTELRNSLGLGQAGVHGISDIRQQAQQAALGQSPLERRVREMALKWLERELGVGQPDPVAALRALMEGDLARAAALAKGGLAE